jgi:UrcA family protein
MASQTSNYKHVTPGRLAVLAAGVLVVPLGLAHAATPAQAAAATVVSYGDLNLASADGTRALYHRIAAAARQVCPLPDSRDLQQVSSAEACRAAAIERAVRDVNNQQLAAFQAEHVKRG